jgi:hypothetical protein
MPPKVTFENKKTPQQSIEAGVIEPRAVLKILADMIHKISNGNLPPNLTKAQIKTYIKSKI